MIRRKVFGFMAAALMGTVSIVGVKPTATEAASIVGVNANTIAPATILRAASNELVSSSVVKSVSGRTYSIEVKETKRKWDSDFDKGTVLGSVRMTTKVYYVGGDSSLSCPAYVECNITVNPRIVKKNNDGSINKVGIPQNVVVEGNYTTDPYQTGYPVKVSGQYQLSSSYQVGYTINGKIDLGWSKKDGFGISGGLSTGRERVTTTSVSYPAKLISYNVISSADKEGFAHWEHKYSLPFIDTQKDKKVRTDMITEVTSENRLYVGLAGKLKTYYFSTSDYIASGYKKTPGYYIDWEKSNLVFDLSASFGGCRGSLTEVYAYELGAKAFGRVRVK